MNTFKGNALMAATAIPDKPPGRRGIKEHNDACNSVEKTENLLSTPR